MTYILKHWRGEYSLAASFWLNVFLINVCLHFIALLLPVALENQAPVLTAQITLVFSFITIAIIYPWQIVGLWRSANRHVEKTGKQFWTSAVRVLVILGVLGTLGNIGNSLTIYKDLYQIGFGKDKYGNYAVELTESGKLIHLKGSLGYGIAEDVERLVTNNPDIQGIILDSIGGYIYEARELSKIILINGFDTYSLTGCYSSCGIAFISGNKRFLATGANLGFHKYKSSVTSHELNDIRDIQNEDLKFYQRRGVRQDFIDKMLKTDNSDLWYPTINEMLNAGVIHEVVDSSSLKPVDYGTLTLKDIKEAYEKIPAYQTIKKYEPDIYQYIMSEIEKEITKGASMVEIQQKISGYIQQVAFKALPKASDKAVIMFARETINVLEVLNNKDPILCMKNLFPEQYGAVNITKYLSKEEMMPMLDALDTVLIDGYENTAPEIDTVAAEAVFERIFLELGDDANYLEGKDLHNKEQYSKSCKTFIRFYGGFLSNNKQIAGNGLRYMFSN